MPCSAGVLAGGQGRRFGGADKGWLPFRGRPFIAWTLDALRPQSAELLISANRHLDAYAALGVPVLPDRLGEGPLAGVAELLAHACQPWLLCAPCDALCLPPDWAARFLRQAERTGADSVMLHDGERAHPTFCLIRTARAADCAAALARGERALYRWLEAGKLAVLHATPPPNVNTPEDLAALESAA